MPCPGSAGCRETWLEQHEEYDLAYVEFTERGNAFDRALEDVRDELLKLVRRLNWTIGPSPEGARRSGGSRKEGSLPRLAVPST